MSSKKHIERVWIETPIGEWPDTSTLGEYTDSPSDWAIVRDEGEYLANLKGETCDYCNGTGKMDDGAELVDCDYCDGTGYLPYQLPDRGREFRFFIPYAGGEKPGTANYQAYGKQDWQRMETLNRGEWSYIGVIAKAQIRVNGISQTVCSGGLWGVESDGGDDYIYDEIGRDQLNDLRDVLASLGFSTAAINRAFESVEHD